jgi:uncharacterized protein GlcG (DUF336 family)
MIYFEKKKSAYRISDSTVGRQVPNAPQAERMAPWAVITAAEAKAVLEAAIKKATEISSPSNIAVVDSYTHLVAFYRMDGAMLASIEFAQKKAHTVAVFGGRFRSGDLGAVAGPNGPLYGIHNTNGGLVTFGGGVPLKKGNDVVGAIGVSGGTVTQDEQIADAAAAALKV